MIVTPRALPVLIGLVLASAVSAREFEPHGWASYLDNPTPHVLPRYNDKTTVNELVNTCPDFYEEMDEECEHRLTDFFVEVPIWASTTFEHFFGDRTFSRGPVLNDRFHYLEYGYEEYVMDDAPTWGDIFDGKFEHRSRVAMQTLENPRCAELGDGSEIRPELAYECQARELFKYAAHLDACATAIDRHSFVAPRAGNSNDSIFELSLKGLSGRLESDPEKLELVSRIHTIWNLQIAWVVQRCREVPLILPDLSLANGRGATAFSLTEGELRDALTPAHDTALKIAAKAGDVWAIQSHYPGREGDIYLRDLHRINPSLMHRYIAARGGHRVTQQEQLQHAAKAYMLLRESSPNANIDIEEYVFGTGHLRLNEVRFNQDYRLSNAVHDVMSNNSQSFPWLNALLDSPEHVLNTE